MRVTCSYGHTSIIAHGDGRAAVDVCDVNQAKGTDHTTRSLAFSRLGDTKCPHCVTGVITSVGPHKFTASDADV